MNSLDQQVAWLEANMPAYQVWYVPTSQSGAVTWHARRWDETAETISAGSPEDLAAAVRAAEGREG